MMPCVIGMQSDKACRKLSELGFEVRCEEYVSRRGVEYADTTRVIRAKIEADNIIELIVSHFRTEVGQEF